MNEQAIFLFARLLIAVFVLRAWMQLAQVDYYNPVTQRFVQTLSPLINPLQTLIPSVGRCNLAALMIAFIIGCGVQVILNPSGEFNNWIIGGTVITLQVTLTTIFWVLLAMVISSWIVSPTNHWVQVVIQLMRPIVTPIQRVIPPIAGLDFSPIVLIFGIQILRGMVDRFSSFGGM